MTADPPAHQVLRRYLTLFYGFTLGLALLLALIAGLQYKAPTPSAVTVEPAASTPTSNPTWVSTPVGMAATPTSLPAIPPTPNEQTPSPLGVTTAQLEGVQVSLWHPWTGAEGAALQAILDQFNRANRWGITIQAQAYAGFGSLDEAVDQALTADALPDVLVDYGYQVRHWDETRPFLDLLPYVDDPVWGFSDEEQADFYPVFWSEDLSGNVSQQGERLGLPFYRSAYGLFYNQSWGREMGYANPPVSAIDFRLRACSAADEVTAHGADSENGKGGWLVTGQPGAAIGWIYSFGGEITNPGGDGYLLDTPQTQQAFDFIKSLADRGCAWYAPEADPTIEFASRRALFTTGSLLDIPAQQRALDQAGSSDAWLFIPFQTSTKPVIDSYGPSLSLFRSEPARQLASWLAIQWLVYPPNQAEWIQAIEVLPTRQSTLLYLGEGGSPQWREAMKLLPYVHSEPSIASWKIIRWAFNDVMAQLFDPQFTASQVPGLLKTLDSTATEIFMEVH